MLLRRFSQRYPAVVASAKKLRSARKADGTAPWHRARPMDDESTMELYSQVILSK